MSAMWLGCRIPTSLSTWLGGPSGLFRTAQLTERMRLSPSEVCSLNISRPYTDMADWSVYGPRADIGPFEILQRSTARCDILVSVFA
jgi:hypothetical protein